MPYNAEPTPEDEVVDDYEETLRRNVVFNVGVPAPDFSLDVEPIQTGKSRGKSLFTLLTLCDVSVLAPGPQVLYALALFALGCICVFCCCLFFPDFPVLSNHTLSHPGLPIL